MRSSVRAAVAALVLLFVSTPHARAQSADEIAWLGVFKMDVTLPYGVMDAYPGGLRLAVENERIPGAVTEQLPAGFLPAHLRLQSASGIPDPRPTANFTLKSWVATMPPELHATLRFGRGANRFESPTVVILADPRASIRWTPAIADKAAVGCIACERPPQVVGKTEADGVYELWAHGRSLVIRPEGAIGGGYAYLGERRRLEKRVSSVIADTVRVADKVLAAKTPPSFGTQGVQNILVHSGELVREATDIAISARGIDFVWRRHYSSAVYSFGPLGRNFDSPLFARVRWLPTGELMYFDGTGRVQRFARDLTPDVGVFLRATNTQNGVVIAYPDNTLFFFDQYGRVTKIHDRNVTTPDGSDGNVMRFTYNAEGRLGSVVDPVGRSVRFAYFVPTASATGGAYPGLLSTVTDFDGRVVRYEYDSYGRLVKVTGPDPGSVRSEQQVTKYVWGPAPTSGNFRFDVLRSGQIISEIDGEGRTVFTATYAASDAWRVQSLVMGGGTWQYAHSDTVMTVTDPMGHERTYAFDGAGRVTSIAEPGGATTRYSFDGEGRLTGVVRPMGTPTPLADATTFTYAGGTPGDKRAMGNMISMTEVPRTGSTEHATGLTRTTTIGYGARNLPTKITGPDGATTTIVRDGRGNPTSMTDATGTTTSFEFNIRGQVTKVVDPRSGTTTFAYQAASPLKTGYLQTVTTSDGPNTYTVDNRGNTLSVAQPGGANRSYVVNKLDQLEEESAANTRTVLSYDGAGALASRQVLAGTDAAGSPVFSTTAFVSDELGRLRTRTEDGRATTYGYDPDGSLTTVTAPGVAPTSYGYDGRDQLLSTTQGTQTTQIAYDLNGTQTSTTNARGKTTSFALDGFGNRIGQTGPTGITTVESVDPGGRPLDVRVIKRVSDTESYILRWTQFTYDAAGRVTRETKKRFASPLRIPPTGDPSGATDVVEQAIYDDAARKVTRIDPRGQATVTEFDAAGRVARLTDAAGNITETTYDENGNQREVKLVEKHPDGTVETFTTRKLYDRANRLVMQIDMNDPKQRATTFKYDERGNRSEEIDAAGRTTKFEYDLRGNMVKQTDPEGGATEYRHDDADRIVWMKDANGNESTYRYDDHGNLVGETRAGGATWSYTYDANNNRKTASDPNGTTVRNTYDDADRLVLGEVTKASGVVGPARISLSYDDLGRTVAAETDEGVKTTALYDSLHQVLTRTAQIGSGMARSVVHTYDLAGNVATRLYPSGLLVTQTHGPLDRIESIRVGNDALVTYADAGTRVVSRTLMNGVRETRGYGATRLLERIENRFGSDVVRRLQYERSPAGEKSAATRTDLAKRWSYGRNRNGWITMEQIERTDTDTNRMLLSTTYDIDGVLNFRSVSRTVQTTQTARTTVTEPVVNKRNQYTSFGTLPLSYDRNGNLLSYRGAELQYDHENRLKKATLADGTMIEHTYDAAGQKVATKTVPKAGPATTTSYVTVGDQVLEEYVDDKLAMRYVRGRAIDEIVRAERSSGFDGTLDQVLFPLQDELGNVDRVTDAAGTTVERYEYAGYGEFRIFSPASLEQTFSAYGWKWFFQGREYDRRLGSFDFRARTLWPELGRFGQEDGARDGAFSDTPNLYQAFHLDFAGRTDPTGMWTVEAGDEVSGPIIKDAIRKARLIYQAYNLGAVYKQINPKYDGGSFLKMMTPPLITLGSCDGGRGNLCTPLPGRVLIYTGFWRTGFNHAGQGAFATLTTGLLHEQGHVEAQKAKVFDSFAPFTWPWDNERIGLPVMDENGWKVTKVILGGALATYEPGSGQTQLYSALAGVNHRSNAAQIDDIRRGWKRLQEWFGNVEPGYGILFDHAKQRVSVIDPKTGKVIPGATAGR